MVDKSGFLKWLDRHTLNSDEENASLAEKVVVADTFLPWQDDCDERVYELLLASELKRVASGCRDAALGFRSALRLYGIFVRSEH